MAITQTMSKIVSVRCTILEERDISLCIEQGGSRVWLPRSGCANISKRPGAMASSIEVPEWLAEGKGLDYDNR
jgi:hypothetical protein